MQQGIVLTLEGIDGSGKTEAARALYAALSPHYKVFLTRQPGATQAGASIRELVQHTETPLDPRTEFLLFAADRAQHIAQIIVPYLAQGYIIISDRMADSSVAYQGYGRGLDIPFIESVNAWAMQGVTPDLTLYLRIDYEIAAARIEKRAEKKTVLEQEQAAFFKRVCDGFDTMFRESPRACIIDASVSQDLVHKACIEQVRSFLQKKGL